MSVRNGAIGRVTRARGALCGAALAAALAAAGPTSAAAQVSVGAQVARAADVFGGVDGVGARIALGIPALPVGLAVHGDWFRTDCPEGVDCSYRTASADLRYRVVPVAPLSPVITGGYTARWIDAGEGESTRQEGVGFGVGLEFRFAFEIFAEARYELVDPEDQWVVRVGLLF